jgi:type IV secretion system protein VirB4
MGGSHHQLGTSTDGAGELAFQPLRCIDRIEERTWAAGWIVNLLEQEGVLVTPDTKAVIWSALENLATAPPAERSLTGLSLLLQSQLLRQALAPFTLEGPHGFETEALMADKGAVAPVLTYLFHRIEARFTGEPTLLILDEAWSFLDHPLFAARIREWLKVLRKKNVAVIFATQSLADIAGSSIAPAIIESCPQRLFLPNDRAAEPEVREAYAGFGLNARQLELIARATPKRDYYLQSSRGNRLFELGLGPVALALCTASDPVSQRRIDALLETHGREGFARAFFAAAGLGWAADLLASRMEDRS